MSKISRSNQLKQLSINENNYYEQYLDLLMTFGKTYDEKKKLEQAYNKATMGIFSDESIQLNASLTSPLMSPSAESTNDREEAKLSLEELDETNVSIRSESQSEGSVSTTICDTLPPDEPDE